MMLNLSAYTCIIVELKIKTAHQELRNNHGNCMELLKGLGEEWIWYDLQPCGGWVGEKQEDTGDKETSEEI